jgi:hypothetical protein
MLSLIEKVNTSEEAAIAKKLERQVLLCVTSISHDSCFLHEFSHVL